MPKLIIIDPDLSNYNGHCFAAARSISVAACNRGLSVSILSNISTCDSLKKSVFREFKLYPVCEKAKKKHFNLKRIIGRFLIGLVKLTFVSRGRSKLEKIIYLIKEKFSINHFLFSSCSLGSIKEILSVLTSEDHVFFATYSYPDEYIYQICSSPN